MGRRRVLVRQPVVTMTVSYLEHIPNAGFLGFYKVLLVWRGSLYKSIWKSFLVYCTLYAIISFCYRYSAKCFTLRTNDLGYTALNSHYTLPQDNSGKG